MTTELFRSVPNARNFFQPNSPGRIVNLIMKVDDNDKVLFNATQLSELGGRELKLYYRENRNLWENLKVALIECGLDVDGGLSVPRGASPPVIGTYYHPALLLDLAWWLAPKLFVQTAIVISDVSVAGGPLRNKLSEVFNCREEMTYERTAEDPSKWSVRYGNLELVIDECGWIDGERLCSRFNPEQNLNLNYEHMKERADVVRLFEYLPERNRLDNANYCHPLVLLRLAMCVNVVVYLKCCSVIFCCASEELRLLFRAAIVGAGSPPPSPETFRKQQFEKQEEEYEKQKQVYKKQKEAHKKRKEAYKKLKEAYRKQEQQEAYKKHEKALKKQEEAYEKQEAAFRKQNEAYEKQEDLLAKLQDLQIEVASMRKCSTK